MLNLPQRCGRVSLFVEGLRMSNRAGLASFSAIVASLELSENLVEPHHHLGYLGVVDAVADALPPDRNVSRGVGDDEADFEQLLKSVVNRELRDFECIGDLTTRLCGVLAQEADDARLHDVPESPDGILRVLTVRGTGVAGHSLSVPHGRYCVDESGKEIASQDECSVIRFTYVKPRRPNGPSSTGRPGKAWRHLLSPGKDDPRVCSRGVREA